MRHEQHLVHEPFLRETHLEYSSFSKPFPHSSASERSHQCENAVLASLFGAFLPLVFIVCSEMKMHMRKDN